MGELIHFNPDANKPHLCIPTHDMKCHIISVKCIAQMAIGRQNITHVPDWYMIVRAIIYEWLSDRTINPEDYYNEPLDYSEREEDDKDEK